MGTGGTGNRRYGGGLSVRLDAPYPFSDLGADAQHFISARTKMDKDRIAGAAKKVVGGVKEAAGKATDDKKLEADGKAQKAEGKVQSGVGQVKDAGRDVVNKH